MIYTEITRKAMQIACKAHDGQTDKSGFPYIHHPLHIAESMKDEKTVAAALLHDVLEDTDVTIDELRKNGIPDDVIEALQALTHSDTEEYLEYIERVRKNPIARRVKIADLQHNMDVSRLCAVTDKDIERIQKYKRALDMIVSYTD